MKVLFRVDFSFEVGAGHLMRCLTLALAMRERGSEVFFLTRSPADYYLNLLYSMGIFVEILREPLSAADTGDYDLVYRNWLGTTQEGDASEVVQWIERQAFTIDWIVLDHYGTDYRWVELVNPSCSNVLVIDDLADRRHHATVLLDQNLGRSPAHYTRLTPKTCRLLIGPRYAVLRKEFTTLRPDVQIRDSIGMTPPRVLINFGGVDSAGITGQALSLLEKSMLKNSSVLDIVVGGAHPDIEPLRRKVRASRFNCMLSVGVTDMANRMRLADFAIGAAGSTTWERCCMALPCIAIKIAANQTDVIKQVSKYGIGVEFQFKESTASSVESMNESIETMLLNLEVFSKNAYDLVDGGGVQRVLDGLLIAKK